MDKEWRQWKAVPMSWGYGWCVDATDVAAATSEALALGATLADDVYAGGRWQVLRDPEGNEFCLLPLELS
jgi:predicted enzyme related to lactoylglutathione lyase